MKHWKKPLCDKTKKKYCQKKKSNFSDKEILENWMQHDTKVEIKFSKFKVKTILRAETFMSVWNIYYKGITFFS